LFSGETTHHTASTESCTLEESCAAFFNSEESFAEFGDESFDMRRTSEFDMSAIDYDLQKEEMEKFEQQKQGRSDGDDENLIEVSPGYCLPLHGSKDTWKAIMAGKIIITRCTCCEEDLTCVEDVQLVICCDCWVFSPVDQSIAGILLEETDEEWFTRNESSGVGLGVKANDIVEWINSQQEAESS
jgi:hypothetical protein